MEKLQYKKFIYLFLITFFTIGGCDVEFGNDDDDTTVNNNTVVRGDITNVASRDNQNDVSGIRAVINSVSDTTTSNGEFSLKGNIGGNNEEIQFQDTNDENTVIGNLRLNILHGANMDLRSIEIDENGSIELSDNALIEFSATVTDNNCNNGIGSIKLEIDDNSNFEVIVLINAATDVERNNQDIDCDDISEGQKPDIEGVCMGTNCNNITADSIEL